MSYFESKNTTLGQQAKLYHRRVYMFLRKLMMNSIINMKLS